MSTASEIQTMLDEIHRIESSTVGISTLGGSQLIRHDDHTDDHARYR